MSEFNVVVTRGDCEHVMHSQEQLDRMCKLFGKSSLCISSRGYLDNLHLYYNNECARHKLLDLIGDMRLAGGFLKAEVHAEKSGHRMNTEMAKAVRALIQK